MTTVQDTAEAHLPQKKPFFGYIPELDVIRAVGITMVILDHMWPYSADHHLGRDILNLSWILMDSFFVLSGFLIGGILLDSRGRPDYFRSFYTRRAFRILPVYYLLITLLTLGNVFFGSGYLYARAPEFHAWGSPWWFFAYLGNIPIAATGKWPTAAGGAFAPLWSLQIEEQFYLLFPLLVYRLKPRTLARTLLGLACTSTVLRILIYLLAPNNKLAQYVLLPCRMDGLALGAWAALRFRAGPWALPKWKLAFAAVAVLTVTVCCGAWGGFAYSHTLGYLLSSIASTLVVIWLVGFRGSRLTTCLRTPVVRHLANISYSAYLYHIPIAVALMDVGNASSIKWLGDGQYLRAPSVYFATILVSSLSWRFFEKPLLGLRERLSGRPA